MPSPVIYDATDWYWVVGGDTSKVYSSKAGDYVPPDNAAYVAWVAAGKQPSQVSDEIELGKYLAPWLVRPGNAAGVLDAYKEAQAAKLTPIDVVPQLLFMMENQVRALQGNPPLTFAQFRTFVKGLM